jgi:APA family basic amino acid/polyamine antiporter
MGGLNGTTVMPKRKLGFVMCVALVIGNMIGTGIFQLPRDLAPLGWNSVYGWVATIAGALCLVLVLLKLGRGRADSCAAYSYPAAAFGPGTGFVVAWSYWVSCWTAYALFALAVVENLAVFWPGLHAPGLGAPTAIAIVWLLTFVNCLGVREAGKVQVLTVALKLLPLAGVILVACWLLLRGDASPVAYHSVPVEAGSINSAATLALFAMLSFEAAMMAGDRVDNPERNVRRATIIGILLTGLIYLLCASAVTLLLPREAVASAGSPFSLFFTTFVSPAAGGIVAIFVAISALGALNGTILVAAEMPLAAAREGLLPAWLVRLNRQEIPWRVHLLSSGLATLLVIASYTDSLAKLYSFMLLVTTSAAILFYLAGALAALWLRARGRLDGSVGFILVCLAATAYCLWAFYGAGIEASLWSLGLTAVAIPIYLIMRAVKRSNPAAAASPAAPPESAA